MVDTHSAVTSCVDCRVQWYCCAVEDNSWSVYRQSEWYNRQPGDPGNKG